MPEIKSLLTGAFNLQDVFVIGSCTELIIHIVCSSAEEESLYNFKG